MFGPRVGPAWVRCGGRVDPSGVKVLELRVVALNRHNAAHAVWVDPVIEE